MKSTKSAKNPRRPSPSRLAESAIDAAHAAGTVLLRYFRKNLKVREKADAGLVSEADLAAEDRIIRTLRTRFPEFGFLTEEAGEKSIEAPGRWIVDPLDGTTNYVHGFPVFCVSIAAEWQGEVLAGAIYHPVLKDTYVAIKGRGAFVNGQRMRVSKTARIEDSLLTTGFSYRKSEFLRDEMTSFERLSEITRAIRRPGSAALDLANTARGIFDGFWERGLSPWDVAAGCLIIQEAGGKVTDFKGNEFSLGKNEILASNGILHDKMTALL